MCNIGSPTSNVCGDKNKNKIECYSRVYRRHVHLVLGVCTRIGVATNIVGLGLRDLREKVFWEFEDMSTCDETFSEEPFF